MKGTKASGSQAAGAPKTKASSSAATRSTAKSASSAPKSTSSAKSSATPAPKSAAPSSSKSASNSASSASKPATHGSNIKIHALSQKYADKAVDCISRSFSAAQVPRDPFSHSLKLKPENWQHMSELFVDRAANKAKSVSFLAYNHDLERVEGVIINEDWKEPLPEKYRDLEPEWRPVRALFKELHIRYMSQRPTILHNTVLHPLYFSCVMPESRRQGITRELWKASADAAREFNFKFMAAEASNRITREVCESLGFKEKASVKYDDWMFEGKKPFGDLPKLNPDFDRIAVYERNITSDLFV